MEIDVSPTQVGSVARSVQFDLVQQPAAQCYSRVEEHYTHGETETLELNTPKNSLFPFYRNALKINGSHSYRNEHDETHSKINGSHSYRNVHDENTFKRKWIVIRTEMCMTKPIQKEMVVIRTEM